MAYAYEGKKLLKQADNEHKETTKHHFLNQVLKFEKKNKAKTKVKTLSKLITETTSNSYCHHSRIF